jgi:hypothetical protein
MFKKGDVVEIKPPGRPFATGLSGTGVGVVIEIDLHRTENVCSYHVRMRDSKWWTLAPSIWKNPSNMRLYNDH